MNPISTCKSRFLVPLFVFLISVAPLSGETTEIGNNVQLLRYYQNPENIVLKTSDGFLRIQTIAAKSLEISYASDSIFIKPSDALIAKPIVNPIIIRNTTESLDVRMGNMYFSIKKAPFEIHVSTGSNNEQAIITGPFSINETTGVNFRLDLRDKILGGGARAIEMNRRGKRLSLNNEANWGYEWGAEILNYSLPIFYSSKKFMVFFDAPQKAVADIGFTNRNRFRIESEEKAFNLYLMTGPDYKALLKEYTTLTGTQPLPPLWALGNLQSKYGYLSQTHASNVVDSIIKDKFPLDAILLDLYWYGKGIGDFRMGNLSWEQSNWPKPTDMINNFNSKNVNTVLITQPYILKSSENYHEADSLGFFATDSANNSFLIDDFWFGPASIIDIFDAKAADWFMQKHKPLIDQGIAGWWSDLGEPEKHPAGIKYKAGSGKNLNNLYGHTWAKTTSSFYRKNYPNQRVFNLIRSGYAGTQRYSTFPRSGDVKRSWAGLKAQLPIMLTMSMSGIPYMHSDVGGYAEGVFNEELYTRWVQLGVFSPIFRPHGDKHPTEPIYYSEETRKIVRNLLNLRYELIPYIYTMAYQQTVHGKPLVRPLMYEQDDDYLLDKYDMYYFGDNLLVAPILEAGANSRRVDLPIGTWLDFFTGEEYYGGRTIEAGAPISKIPVFVKAGSFIPTIKAQTSLPLIQTDNLTITFYYHNDVTQASGELYLDDGKSPDAIKKGNYQLFSFSAQNSDKELSIDISHNDGVYLLRPGRREIELLVKNLPGRPENVRVDGKGVEFRYIPKDKQVQVKFTMGSAPVNIKIK
ncbi:MAG: DUF5110 domain-containing protein [Bacteroidales bacterium]|jgi:alpha-glucosidase (family GH31 glycosyl hydrolase)|nr:DUF5110 domain-containing protein [Bacteroidales bacterium]